MPDVGRLVTRLVGRAPAVAIPPDRLAETARAIARGLSAGLPLQAACARAAAGLDEPAAGVVAAVAHDLAAGLPPEAALAPLRAARGGGLMVGAVVLHVELGGDLAASLDALADGLDETARLDAELRAVTAQARLAARLVPLVPLAAAAMLAAVSPASIGPLVATAAGRAIVCTSALLTLGGLVLVRRILASERL